MSLCAMKLHGTREPTVIGHESGKDKNQNIFCFSTHLDKFLMLKKTNKFAFFSLNRNFVVILQPKI